MNLDKLTIAFMLYLGTWLNEDEEFEDLTDADFIELKKKWVKEWLPGLTQMHKGDCTKECMPCMRCTMEDIMNTAERIRDA